MIKKVHPVFVVERYLTAIIFMILAAIFFSSCKIYKPAYYFKDITRDTVISDFVNNDLELTIQKNDVLNISISSLNALEDALFNNTVPGTDGKIGYQGGFHVSLEGNIYMHKLGKIAAAGLTRKELKAKLENDLLPYLKDPIVKVNFANHRITVLGEGNSMIVEMPEEKLSILEVLAKSGSGAVTQNSQLSKLMVIRENQNTKQVKHLNLEDPSIFTSPFYYLQPNDVVVVKPNEEKIDDAQRRINNQLLYTSIITGITFIILLMDRIFE